MPKQNPKKRRLVKGKDYDGWRVRYPDGSVDTKVWTTKADAEVWYPAKWLVRVKLVEVKP